MIKASIWNDQSLYKQLSIDKKMAIVDSVGTFLYSLASGWSSVVLILLVLLLTLFYNSRYFAFYTRRTPPGPTLIPLLGCIPTVAGEFTGDYFAKQALKYKSSIISMRVFGGLVVALNDYDLIKEIFSKRTDLVDRNDFTSFDIIDPNYKGIIFTDGRPWKEQRRFTLHMMKDLGMGKIGAEDMICHESTKAIEALKEHNGKPCDPLHIINMAVSNIINFIVFGKRFEYSDAKFRNSLASLNAYVRAMGSPKFPLLFLRIGQYLLSKYLADIRQNYKVFSDFVMDEIDQHKRKFDGTIKDFIDAYLAEMRTNEDKESFNDEQLRYTITDLFFAGSETTFTTLRWTLLYMAAYPEVQKKVQEELDSVIGPDRIPSMNDKKHTPYTEAVLSEVQRVNTLVELGIGRTNRNNDFEINGYLLPKQTAIVANLHQVHRDPRFWKNPEAFDPENFLDDDGNVTNLDKLVQFSLGRRSCAGEALARMELYIFFASWVKEFHVKLESDDTVPNLNGTNSGINQPKPHLLRLFPRCSRTLTTKFK